MILIRDITFAAIDFESAGSARGETDVPVQIGLACWSLAKGHERHFVSYLRSPRPIAWSARKVHGISDEDLIDAPNLPMLWPEVKQRLHGAAIVAHAKGTEKRFLRAYPGHSFGPWIDTLLLARAAWPDHPAHSLSELCEAASLSNTVQQLVPERRWHDALYDAVGSLVLLSHIIETFQLADQPLAVLEQVDTSAWHRGRR